MGSLVQVHYSWPRAAFNQAWVASHGTGHAVVPPLQRSGGRQHSQQILLPSRSLGGVKPGEPILLEPAPPKISLLQQARS